MVNIRQRTLDLDHLITELKVINEILDNMESIPKSSAKTLGYVFCSMKERIDKGLSIKRTDVTKPVIVFTYSWGQLNVLEDTAKYLAKIAKNKLDQLWV